MLDRTERGLRTPVHLEVSSRANSRLPHGILLTPLSCVAGLLTRHAACTGEPRLQISAWWVRRPTTQRYTLHRTTGPNQQGDPQP